jgi:hypothetical protein
LRLRLEGDPDRAATRETRASFRNLQRDLELLRRQLVGYTAGAARTGLAARTQLRARAPRPGYGVELLEDRQRGSEVLARVVSPTAPA